jgi:hypothetical protein
MRQANTILHIIKIEVEPPKTPEFKFKLRQVNYSSQLNHDTDHLVSQNPTGKILGGVGITSVNTFLFLSTLSLPSIASFHLFQSEHFLHSAMVLRSGSARTLSAIMV